MTDLYTRRANIRNMHKMDEMSDAELLSLVALNEKIAAENREPFGSLIVAASASAIAAEAFRFYAGRYDYRGRLCHPYRSNNAVEVKSC